MSTLKDKVSQFIAQEQAVGISLQQFKQKFVFNSNSGPDAIFIDNTHPTPSQILGMTKPQQNQCISLMTEMIFRAGQMLKLPVSTTIVAINLAQYYFTRKSFFDYDFRDISMGAMFLACKSEETLRRSYQVAEVFDHVFKLHEGYKMIRELESNSTEYNYMKDKVIKTQNEILFQLGFEAYKLFDIPHRYISGLLASFNKHKDCNSIVQHSWTFLNDIYRTRACVYFPGQAIAAAAVFMALQKLSIPMPEKPWWILMEASIDHIKQIFILTSQMYAASNNNEVNINKVSQILQKVGKQALNMSNVFPASYYRKIRLDDQGMIMNITQPDVPKVIQEQKINHKYDSQEERQERNKEKSKKQKKKDKKKHKHQRINDRSKSRSPQSKKDHQKGKYQNDDQTPKVKRSNINAVQQNKIQAEKLNDEQAFQKQDQIQKIAEQAVPRKASQISAIGGTKQQTAPTKKSVLSDAKSMLSKISLQIKKIEVKNELTSTVHQQLASENGNHKNIESQEDQQKNNSQFNKVNQQKSSSDKNSDSDEQDELLAELIQIKKKNLQKKEDTN